MERKKEKKETVLNNIYIYIYIYIYIHTHTLNQSFITNTYLTLINF